MTPYNYAKKCYQEGKFAEMTIDGAAGIFYLCDRDYKPLNGKNYKSREEAEIDRSKILDRAGKFIK